jgi:cytoskeletal protein RodZ
MSRDDTNIDWQLLGQQFRQQREAAGMPVETAAHQLCLAKSQVLALETGLSANFPGTPARLWCAQRYAKLLGIDLDAIAPQATVGNSPELGTPAVLDKAFSDSESLARTPPSTMGKGYWVVALLFLALLVILAIQAYQASSPAPVQPKPAAIPDVSLPVVPAAAPVPEQEAIPAAPIEDPKPEPVRKLVEIQGIEAHKPARSVYVMAHEAAVLIKQRDGQEAETLSLAKGASQRISLAADERLRVAEGKNLGIFFQGRKVSANTIEAGNWMRFVPLRE